MHTGDLTIFMCCVAVLTNLEFMAWLTDCDIKTPRPPFVSYTSLLYSIATRVSYHDI